MTNTRRAGSEYRHADRPAPPRCPTERSILARGLFTLGGFVVVGRFVLDQKRLAPNGVKVP